MMSFCVCQISFQLETQPFHWNSNAYFFLPHFTIDIIDDFLKYFGLVYCLKKIAIWCINCLVNTIFFILLETTSQLCAFWKWLYNAFSSFFTVWPIIMTLLLLLFEYLYTYLSVYPQFLFILKLYYLCMSVSCCFTFILLSHNYLY